MNFIEYYHKHLEKYQLEAQRLFKQMTLLSSLRLMVFVATGFGVYMLIDWWQVALIVSITGISVFIYLLSKHTDVKGKHAFHKALVAINKDEIKIAAGDFHERDKGLEFQDSNHFYSLDIDLFGRGSFFQFINRTTIKEGTVVLAEALKANNIEDIELRQETIKELASKPQWRQYYTATSNLVEVETPAEQIINWLKHHKSFLPRTMFWLPLVFSVVSVAVFALTILEVITMQALIGYWLLLGLVITGIYIKKINILASNTDRVRDTFRQYSNLLDLIENESFSSELLIVKQKQIQLGDKKASAIFKQFARSLDALDNRNNLIGAIFGNGLFLTDLKNSFKIEQWISKYADKVSDWFEVVSFFDAYNSLGNYVFNHPDFVFPKIEKSGTVIKAENLGHPLLEKTKRVTSDLNINEEQFFIVTGANMAGKSTFLRTVSLHIVMANVGLPVCANKTNYKPIKLVTSMRTSDSLVDDSSYFFAELTRLKYIVDVIKEEPYFIILDEILKGTNSVDKALGSKKFIEKLVASQATGIIATHDLSLCDIETQLPQVHNYFFDADIINDELHFDYKLKKGVCQKMNASFLLKKMEII
mgnify:CR=1 FL=1